MVKIKKMNWLELLIFVVIIEATGFLSSFLSGNIRPEYMRLIKPPFAPPGLVFGIVWPILYASMGIAVYRVFNHHSKASKYALLWFGIQLFLNFCWSIVFFRFELFWAAVAIIVALDVTVAYTIYLFGKIDKIAQWLMIPYLLWIIFATYLNIGFAILN